MSVLSIPVGTVTDKEHPGLCELCVPAAGAAWCSQEALSSQFALARGQREMKETATGEVTMLSAAAAVRHCFGYLGLPKDHPI